MRSLPQPSHTRIDVNSTLACRPGTYRSLYRFHHTQRFKWLREKIVALGKQDISVVEIGCADATSLDYIPVPICRYLGFDAGWRSGWSDGQPYGMEAARQRYSQHANFDFRQSGHYTDVARISEEFDVGIVLETFEYLPTRELESYIATMAGKLNSRGCLFSSMPNEKGIPLLVKALGAKFSGVRRSEYTTGQFLNALCGRLDHVPRVERGRKGFDYAKIVGLIQRHFRFVHLEAVGFRKLPHFLSLNVGVIASHAPISNLLV